SGGGSLFNRRSIEASCATAPVVASSANESIAVIFRQNEATKIIFQFYQISARFPGRNTLATCPPFQGLLEKKLMLFACRGFIISALLLSFVSRGRAASFWMVTSDSGNVI